MKRNLLFLIATAGIALAANLTYADTVSWSNTAPTGANYFDLTIQKSETLFPNTTGLAISINYFNADGTAASVLNKETGKYITQYDQLVELPFSSTAGVTFRLLFSLNAAGLSMDGVMDPEGTIFGTFPVEKAFVHATTTTSTDTGRTDLLGFLGGSVGGFGVLMPMDDGWVSDTVVSGLTMAPPLKDGNWNFTTFSATDKFLIESDLVAGVWFGEDVDPMYSENWSGVTLRFYGGDARIENAGAATPEPATLAVLGLGLAGLAALRRRKR